MVTFQRALAFFLLAILPALAQRIPGEYLVELSTPPLAELARTSPDRTVRRNAILSEQRQMHARLEAMGADVFASMETAGNLLAVHWEGDEAALRATPGVSRVYRVYQRRLLLDQARVLHELPAAWARAGGIENAGKGVKIAIIDTGIDPQHAAFRDDTLELPAGYPKFRRAADEAVTSRKVIVARSYDDLYRITGSTSARDQVGHGTAVAMAAAGKEVTANYATISGVAPKAFLGAYRVFPYDGEGASDTAILAAIDDAINDGMNVINLSLGYDISDNAIDAVYANVFRRAIEHGVLVVAAVGNAGPSAGTIGSPAYVPGALAVGATANRRVIQFPVIFQGREFAGTLSSGPAGASVEAPLADAGLACSTIPSGQLTGKIAVIDRGDCFFEVKLINAQQAGARAAVVVNNIGGEPITMAVGQATLPALMIRRDDGTALRALLAASPDTPGQVAFAGRESARDARRIAQFSSRGPSPNAALKPDLAAVGAFVYTASPSSGGQSQYQFINGTSFSAPIVAGAAAVLRAHRPGLTVAQYRSLLAGSARDWGPEGEREFSPLEIGTGLLQLDAALRTSIAASEISLNFGVAKDNAIHTTRTLELSNLSAAPDTLVVQIHWLSGRMPSAGVSTVDVPVGESRSVEFRVDIDGMEKGTSMGIVIVRSTLTGTFLRIPYWFANPAGVAERLAYWGASPTPQAGLSTQLFFRLFDLTGLPLFASDVAAESETEGLEIGTLTSYENEAPGLYGVRVRPRSGENTVLIRVGEFSQTISFRAN